MKLFIQFAALLLILFFVSCKKEYAKVQTSQKDTTYNHLPIDYKLDTTFTYTANPTIDLVTLNGYISEQRFYLPILRYIDTKNLKVMAWYNNHMLELRPTGSASRYTRSENSIFVHILVMARLSVNISVRITN